MSTSYLITGATGLIGSALVRSLALRGERVIAAVRNIEKAHAFFGNLPSVEIVFWDVTKSCDYAGTVDYLIHTAAETASRNMVEKPVETITIALDGVRNVLEFARAKQVKSMVYLSSMEVYGDFTEKITLDETAYGRVNQLSVRSSYPESKRMSETLCIAYASEYAVKVKIARLVQVVPDFVPENDNRVIAQFARAVARGNDITLKTDGSAARCYCHISDAVSGILAILERGMVGEAYNVGNDSSYLSIRELAEKFIATKLNCTSKLHFETISNLSVMGFPPSSKLAVTSRKLESLGWHAKVSLDEMVANLIVN